jgi:2,4-dienoyl-CoA reductase-like NADH-dependent reductase (Old Yellow Enzyme family)
VPYPGYPVPAEMAAEDIAQVVADFADAARRAVGAGFDVVEINAADGGLLHEFYSPLSNHRYDAYGYTYNNRVRMLREVVESVRAVWGGPLFVRLAATDWSADGWDGNDAVALAVLMRSDGVDLVDVSTGGNVAAQIPMQPGYQVPFAQRIRHFAGLATGVSGLIADPRQAEAIIGGGHADAVFLGRAALREPHWPQRAARDLGVPVDQAPYVPQHIRGAWPKARSAVAPRRAG